MISFQNKVAFVTGGTSGIGRSIAVAFATAGAQAVAILGRRAEEGTQTVKLVEQAGGRGLFIRADVSREADLQSAVEQTVKAFGRLDIAVNNAGIEHFAPMTELTEDLCRRTVDTNILGTLLAIKHEAPAIAKGGGGGAIVNMTSIFGGIGMAGTSLYAATKHAVIGITKCAALELAGQKIRVNAVAPGAIQTEMLDRITGGTESDFRKVVIGLHPIGRIGRPEEIADAALWLASERASFVTGQTVFVDGGYTAQ